MGWDRLQICGPTGCVLCIDNDEIDISGYVSLFYYPQAVQSGFINILSLAVSGVYS
jgi:hypothetical protein